MGSRGEGTYLVTATANEGTEGVTARKTTVIDVSESSSIGDTVWLDLDGDGVQDAGESGIPNVTVYLKDSGGATIRTVTTDADGTYNFFLPTETGDFTVEVDTATLPVGLVQSGDPDATCPSAGCDVKTPSMSLPSAPSSTPQTSATGIPARSAARSTMTWMRMKTRMAQILDW